MNALLLATFPVQTHANPELAVEPYLGYSQLSYSENSKFDQRYGTILGGKGGIEPVPNILIALDYHLGGPYYLENNQNEYMNRMWGAGVGARGVGRLKLWAGYYFDAALEDIERNILFKGTAMKLSAGIEFTDKIFVNFEYVKFNIREVQATNFTFPSELDVSVLFVSLSAPLLLK